MSVQKAFDILNEALGKEFAYKSDFEGFKSIVTDGDKLTLEKIKRVVRKTYPSTHYIYFNASFDEINRCDDLHEVQITNSNKEGLTSEGIDVEIWSFLYDSLTQFVETPREVEFEEFKKEFEGLYYFRLNFETNEIYNYENIYDEDGNEYIEED